jgi:hypothetical protein
LKQNQVGSNVFYYSPFGDWDTETKKSRVWWTCE